MMGKDTSMSHQRSNDVGYLQGTGGGSHTTKASNLIVVGHTKSSEWIATCC